MGSEDYAASKSGGEDGSSLAARRARLRGTLAKQALPPDPYTPDPYLATSTAGNGGASPTSQSEAETQSTPQNGSPVSDDNGSNISAALFSTATAPDAVQEADETSSRPEVDQVVEGQHEQEPARVDRRRGPAGPATLPPGLLQNLSNSITEDENAPSAPPAPSPDPIQSNSEPDPFQPDPFQAAVPVNMSENFPTMTAMPPNPVSNEPPILPGQVDYVYGIQPEASVMPQAPTQMQTQALEIMNNIDQAMGACAMNLSELQKIAIEQTEALKGVSATLQNQNFFENSLNLNSLMESLSAALEPMKAVGELVPAIDQLVSIMESRESGQAEEAQRLSPDQLVTNLADQLSAGVIDPWTFKCAYMAVYPADHPADLLHRLVDLLGTQRLSGDLFRSAYEAVQAADGPPMRLSTEEGGEGASTRTVIKVVQDEVIVAQLEELKRINEEFQKKNEEVIRKLEAKDQEFATVLTAKEQELHEAQELLNSRWEEFNTRYDELTETLHKRDEALQEKEAELARKESENAQLRAQMSELRDQTKDMVADLQKQLSKPQEVAQQQQAPPKPAGFFDVAPGGNLNQQQQQQGQLFDAGPSRPLFGQEQQQQQPGAMDQSQQQAPQQQPQQQQPQQQQQQPQPAQPNQAVPRPPAPTTPFVTGSGSYGSGVRAQVFEVIVRQALAGAPWREICAGPMQVNNISPEEVEAEVKRRQALLKK